MTKEFSSGDLVKIVGNTKNLIQHYAPIGSVGKIDTVNDSYLSYSYPYAVVDFSAAVPRTDDYSVSGEWHQSIAFVDLEKYVPPDDPESQFWDTED